MKLHLIFRASCIAVVLVSAFAFAQSTAANPNAPNSADQAVVNDFNQRIQQYLDARKKAQPGSPPQSSDAEKLVLYRDHFRDKLLSTRLDAKQGDIFAPEIADYFKHQIATTLKGPHGRRILASMKRAEPVHGIPLKVNGKYPSNVPLQSTPASLLLNLPQLPKELEYRVADRALVLRDKEANLIVDYIPQAIELSKPQPKP